MDLSTPCIEFASYADFATEFLFTVMKQDYAVIIVNYHDAAGIIQSLNEKTINGVSFYLDMESYEMFDNDISTAKDGSGMMMITAFASGRIISEPVVYDRGDSYITATYFVEADAKDFANVPISGGTVLFQIAKEVI